jgi:hypothetical protein
VVTSATAPAIMLPALRTVQLHAGWPFGCTDALTFHASAPILCFTPGWSAVPTPGRASAVDPPDCAALRVDPDPVAGDTYQTTLSCDTELTVMCRRQAVRDLSSLPSEEKTAVTQYMDTVTSAYIQDGATEIAILDTWVDATAARGICQLRGGWPASASQTVSSNCCASGSGPIPA